MFVGEFKHLEWLNAHLESVCWISLFLNDSFNLQHYWRS